MFCDGLEGYRERSEGKEKPPKCIDSLGSMGVVGMYLFLRC